MDLEAPPGGQILDSQLEAPPGGEILRDGPNDPHGTKDHPSDTMRYLAQMARDIYGFTPAGAITNLPAGVRGLMGKPQPEGLTPSQQAAGAGGAAIRAGAPGAAQFLADNGDVIAGGGAGAMASLPYAAAAGPFAPVVPVVGGAIGAVAARSAVRPIQNALQKAAGNDLNGPGYATASDLSAAAKQGAEQEAGGQILTAGIKMGVEGLNSAKAAIISKAKEILPDMGENLLSVPSESINRVLDRFRSFNNGLKSTFNGSRRVAQIKADKIAEKSYTTLVDDLDRTRKVYGKLLERSENKFIQDSGDTPVADYGKLTDILDAWKAENPGLVDSPDYAKIVSAVNRYKPSAPSGLGTKSADAIVASNAVKLRRELDGLSTWSSGGVRPIENDVADRLAKTIGSQVRQDIKAAAEQSGGSYAKRLAEFSDLADAHANAIDSLRTASGYDKSIATKLDALSTQFNAGGAKQEALMNIGKDIPGSGRIQRSVHELADALAVRSFQKVPKRIPSGVMLRIVNAVAPTRSVVGAAGSALSGVPSSLTIGPAVGGGSRLAAALAAQQAASTNEN